MPAYNAERWIRDAIESVLAQTYEAFELVVSDNASTDGTREIVGSYRDRRVRVETAATPIEAVANHNRSVLLATGDYVKFLHADDMLLPTCLEEMVALLGEDPRIGFVFAPREVLLEDPDRQEALEWNASYSQLHRRFEALSRVNDGRTLFQQLLAAGIDTNWIGEPSAVIATRACLAHVGLFNPRLHQIADLDLWLRIMLSYRVGYIGHSLSVYRHHARSVSAMNARLGRDWLDRLWLLEGLLAEQLEPDERRRVASLRRQALRDALRAQAGRLARRRLTADLPRYLWYRAQAAARRAPPLTEPLPPAQPEQARPPESPATFDHAPT